MISIVTIELTFISIFFHLLFLRCAILRADGKKSIPFNFYHFVFQQQILTFG